MSTTNWDRVHREDRLFRFVRTHATVVRIDPNVTTEEYQHQKEREAAILERKSRRTF